MATLKPQSYGPLYSNTVIGTLAVDGCAVTFGTARMGLCGLGPRPVPSSLYQIVTDHPSTASVPTVYYLIWHYNNTKFSRHLAVNGWIKQIKKL